MPNSPSESTTDHQILEQVEMLPRGLTAADVIGLRHSVRLSFYAAKLAEQKPEVEKVCQKSEIREERTFSRGEIEKLIGLFAMAHGLEADDLRLSKIINDEKGVLLSLEVKALNPDGSGYKLINYTIKGRHDRNQSQTTNLDMTLWDADDMPEGGELIAEYSEGKWNFKI